MTLTESIPSLNHRAYRNEAGDIAATLVPVEHPFRITWTAEFYLPERFTVTGFKSLTEGVNYIKAMIGN